MLANSVSPPAAGHLARHQHAGHRRHVEIGRVRVPDAAEVDLLVLELEDGE